LLRRVGRGLRSVQVLGIVEVLGHEASDADETQVVEEGADLLRRLVDSVRVLVEQRQEHLFAAFAVAVLAARAGSAS